MLANGTRKSPLALCFVKSQPAKAKTWTVSCGLLIWGSLQLPAGLLWHAGTRIKSRPRPLGLTAEQEPGFTWGPFRTASRSKPTQDAAARILPTCSAA